MSSFAGAAETKAAQKLLAQAAARERYPFPWIEPPPGSIHFSPFGRFSITGTGQSNIIVSYTIPEGFAGVVTGVVVDIEMTNGTPVPWAPGDIDWSLAINFGTIAGAIGGPALRFFQDLNQVPFTVGSFGQSSTGAPWPITSGETDVQPPKTVLTLVGDVNGNTGGWIGGGPVFPEFRGAITGYRFPAGNIT